MLTALLFTMNLLLAILGAGQAAGPTKHCTKLTDQEVKIVEAGYYWASITSLKNFDEVPHEHPINNILYTNQTDDGKTGLSMTARVPLPQRPNNGDIYLESGKMIDLKTGVKRSSGFKFVFGLWNPMLGYTKRSFLLQTDEACRTNTVEAAFSPTWEAEYSTNISYSITVYELTKGCETSGLWRSLCQELDRKRKDE